jgi:predicted amidophosphoribosyltransferase
VTDFRDTVRERVGEFFRNTARIPGRTCEVCTTPVDGYQRCLRCHDDARSWDGELADIVVPLAYAYEHTPAHRAQAGRHQSEQHMWSYKNVPPGPGCVSDLTLMLATALHFHHACAAQTVGAPWQAWAVVPSSRHHRAGDHPLERLARAAGLGRPSSRLPDQVRLVLVGEPGEDRDVHEDRFAVLDPDVTQGQHILLLDDTWVTGASAQSAAITLNHAGATAVTTLCLARWVKESNTRADVAGFFATLSTPYDPLSCPVLGGPHCAGPFGSAV